MSRPTLVIGLGGTGQWVLTYIKKELLEEGQGTLPKEVKLLAFDTAPQMTESSPKPREEEPIVVEGVRLDAGEFRHMGGNIQNIVREIVTESAHPHIAKWLQAKTYLTSLPAAAYDLEEGAGQMRPFGRMAVFKSLEASPTSSHLFSSIQEALQSIRAEVHERGSMEIAIVASLSGGTGSGMAIDVAHLTRTIARDTLGDRFTMRGFFVLPAAFQSTFAGGNDLGMKARAFATLRELSRFLTVFGDRAYPMDYNLNAAFSELREPVRQRLFDLCYLVDAGREKNPLETVDAKYGVYPSLADAILTFIDDHAGKDQATHATNVMQKLNRNDCTAYFSTLGTYAFKLPLNDIIEQHACTLALEFLVTLTSPEMDVSGNPKRLADNENRERDHASGADEAREFMNNPRTAEGARGTLYLREVLTILDQGGDRSSVLVEQEASRETLDLLRKIEPDMNDADFSDVRLEVSAMLIDNRLRQKVKTSKELKRKPNLDYDRIIREVDHYRAEYLGRTGDDGLARGGKFRQALERYRGIQKLRFSQCLTHQCLELLNGTGDAEPRIARGGKLGYGLAFLRELTRSLERYGLFLGAVRQYRGGIGALDRLRHEAQASRAQMTRDKEKFGFLERSGFTSQTAYLAAAEALLEAEKQELLWDMVGLVTEDLLEVTNDLLAAFKNWSTSLVLGDHQTTSIYARIQAARHRVIARREHAAKLAPVQREITNKAYEELLYRRRADDYLDQLLRKSHWSIDVDRGEVMLHVGRQPFRGEKHRHLDSIEARARLLLDITKDAFETLAQEETVAKRLMDQTPDDVADAFHLHGSPLLRLRRTPPHMEPANYLSIQCGRIEGDAPFFEQVALGVRRHSGAKKDDAQLTSCGNTYKATLVNTQDVIELPSLALYEELKKAYMEYPANRTLLHNFPAEVHAVHYEDRLQERNKSRRTFSTRITFILEHRPWVRHFLRALVYGLIVRDKDDEGLPLYALKMPETEFRGMRFGAKHVWLTQPQERMPDLFEAIDTFVFKRNDCRCGGLHAPNTPIEENHLKGILLAREAESGDEAANIERIHQFLDESLGGYLQRMEQGLKTDLEDLFHLMLADEVERLALV
ncbi:Tubulin like [Sulfidibacter corallicola]|uniref:Tubulin like n=1 Tax=Sulfidibacter corallicola TaxID=2818388 RepID=A0A8A4TRJ4_SULCO|nr:tubulin-like doman-containing protein [Sulfidibacter corallicola]QTD51794.1 hypothetical protein J3U87_04930 [Sulfidibacter corallicola]